MSSWVSLINSAHPPGPTGLQNAHVLRQINRNPLTTMMEMAQLYGDIVHIGFGPYRVYLLNHPDYLHEILVRQAHLMCKPKSLSRPIAEFLGNGLLISHGDYWKHQRQLIQPAFHHRHIKAYIETMVACVQETVNHWEHNSILDIDHEFMKMTFKMVTRTLFSVDQAEHNDRIAEAVKVLQRVSYQQGQDPLHLPPWLPLPGHIQKQRAINLLTDVVTTIIHNRRMQQLQSDDLLSMLLNAEDVEGNPLSDQQIHNEVMTVLLAGHESTANGLSWMWYALEQNREAQNTLTTELTRVLQGCPPTADNLSKLDYTNLVIKEALRLYPPAWALPREATQNFEMGGYVIPKGSLLLGLPFVIHRDPRYYDAPEQFHPDRFANNREYHLPRHAYLPFGSGPRYCIGSGFALTAMKVTLAIIHQLCTLETVPNQRVELDPLLTLRPRYGLHMRVKLRHRPR